MSDTILVDASLRLISAAIDEYADWYAQVQMRVFYPGKTEEMGPVDLPKSITALQELLKRKPDLIQGEIDRVLKSCQEMHDIASTLISGAERAQPPGHEEYSEFIHLYDDLLRRMRSIERNQYLAGRGYDSLTGLRTGDVMFFDLEKEMERVARRGRIFSMALARLDEAEALESVLGDNFKDLVRHIGQAIVYTTRTFDDSYRLPDNEFVMALKHADLQGAQRFVMRLREYLNDRPFMIDDKKIEFSLSFCVSEPVIGEDIRKFVQTLRQDLHTRGGKSSDAIVFHEEESPLRRFMREQQTK